MSEALSYNQALDRLPPHALEAESAVLGAMMMDPLALNICFGILTDADFFKGAHRLTFEACRELSQKNTPVDLTTVLEYLASHGQLEAAGGPVGLANHSERTAAATNVESYATIVKAKSKLRQLITACAQVTQDAYQRQEESSLVIDGAMAKVMEISQAQESDFEMVGTGWEADYQELEKVSLSGQRRGYPISLQRWNEVVGGIIPGKVYVIGAQPGTGKSALCLNIACDMAALKVPTALFSLEMDNFQMRNRIVAGRAELDGWRIEQGMMSQQELQQYRQVMQQMKGKPLYFHHDRSMSLLQLLSKARLAVMRFGVKVIILDYIQMLSDDSKKHSTKAAEYSHIARELARFADKNKVALIEAAQLNRDLSKADREPRKTDLKESSGFEENADIVCLMHEVDRDSHIGQPTIPVKLIFDKHRGGPIGSPQVNYVRRFLRFEDIHGNMARQNL